jgi:diamine N-acetyltransferase
MSQTEMTENITLREITSETVRAVCDLSLTMSAQQRKMVADNAVSIAEAHFCRQAWFRAIYAGETLVGFVMLYIGDGSEEAEEAGVYLWRLMIAGPHQGRGYGKKALQLVLSHLKTQCVNQLKTSYVVCEDGGALGFYEKLGFLPTGTIGDDGEAGLLLDF